MPRKLFVSAWRSTRLSTCHVFARLRTVRCDECLRPIRCWNRRVWLGDECCSHLQCFEGQLFLRALVAGEIRRWQLIASDVPLDPRGSQPSDIDSTENNLRNPVPSTTTLSEPIELLEAAAQQREEVPKPHVVENQSSGNSCPRKLGLGVWHFVGRFALNRPPPPPLFCMLCGAVELSKKSVFCSKCGTSLRP
jgi:hypothetical protein